MNVVTVSFDNSVGPLQEWVAAINLLAEKTRPQLMSCLDARHSPLVLRASPFLPRCSRLVTPSPVLDRRPWTAIPMNRCQGPPPPVSARFGKQSIRFVGCTRYKIQEALFNVGFGENMKTLALLSFFTTYICYIKQ